MSKHIQELPTSENTITTTEALFGLIITETDTKSKACRLIAIVSHSQSLGDRENIPPASKHIYADHLT